MARKRPQSARAADVSGATADVQTQINALRGSMDALAMSLRNTATAARQMNTLASTSGASSSSRLAGSPSHGLPSPSPGMGFHDNMFLSTALGGGVASVSGRQSSGDKVSGSFDRMMDQWQGQMQTNRQIAKAGMGLAATHLAGSIAQASASGQQFRPTENMTSILGGLGSAASLIPKLTPYGLPIMYATGTAGAITDAVTKGRREFRGKVASFEASGFSEEGARKGGRAIDALAPRDGIQGWWGRTARASEKQLQKVNDWLGVDEVVNIPGNQRVGTKKIIDLTMQLSSLRNAGYTTEQIQNASGSLAANEEAGGVEGTTQRAQNLSAFMENPYFADKAAKNLTLKSGGLGLKDAEGMVLATDMGTAVRGLSGNQVAQQRAVQFAKTIQQSDFALERSGYGEAGARSGMSIARSQGFSADTGQAKTALAEFVAAIDTTTTNLKTRLSSVTGSDQFSVNERAKIKMQLRQEEAGLREAQYQNRAEVRGIQVATGQARVGEAFGAAGRAMFGRSLGSSPKQLDTAIAEADRERGLAETRSKDQSLGTQERLRQRGLAEGYRQQAFEGRRTRFEIQTFEPAAVSEGFTGRRLQETAFYAPTANADYMRERLQEDQASLQRTLAVERRALAAVQGTSFTPPKPVNLQLDRGPLPVQQETAARVYFPLLTYPKKAEQSPLSPTVKFNPITRPNERSSEQPERTLAQEVTTRTDVGRNLSQRELEGVRRTSDYSNRPLSPTVKFSPITRPNEQEEATRADVGRNLSQVELEGARRTSDYSNRPLSPTVKLNPIIRPNEQEETTRTDVGRNLSQRELEGVRRTSDYSNRPLSPTVKFSPITRPNEQEERTLALEVTRAIVGLNLHQVELEGARRTSDYSNLAPTVKLNPITRPGEKRSQPAPELPDRNRPRENFQPVQRSPLQVGSIKTPGREATPGSPLASPEKVESLRNSILANTLKAQELSVQAGTLETQQAGREISRLQRVGGVEIEGRAMVRRGYAADVELSDRTARFVGDSGRNLMNEADYYSRQGPRYEQKARDLAAEGTARIGEEQNIRQEGRLNFRSSARSVVGLQTASLAVDLAQNDLRTGGFVPHVLRDNLIGQLNTGIGERSAMLSSIEDPEQRAEATARLMPEISSLMTERQRQRRERELGSMGHLISSVFGAPSGSMSYVTTEADVSERNPGASPVIGGDGSNVGIPSDAQQALGFTSLGAAIGGSNAPSMDETNGLLRSIERLLATGAAANASPVSGSSSGNVNSQLKGSASGGQTY